MLLHNLHIQSENQDNTENIFRYRYYGYYRVISHDAFTTLIDRFTSLRKQRISVIK